MLRVVSQPPETFPTAQGKEFKQTPPFMDQHHFSTTKTRPLPKKSILKSTSPKKNHPSPCRPHWRHPHHGSSPRVKSPLVPPYRWRRRFSQWSLENQPDYAQIIQVQSILVGVGFFFGRFPLPLFLKLPKLGGSENWMVGDYTLFFEF